MDNPEKNFVSIDEAAKLLQIHRTTLFGWIKKSKQSGEKTGKKLCPHYHRMGSRYRFKREDIENFIKESRES